MDENIIDQIDEKVISVGSTVVAGLALVGVATIAGAATFGIYKLSKKIVDKVWHWSQIKKVVIRKDGGE